MSGAFRHIVTIDEYTPTRAPTGGELPGWTPYRTAFASIEPLRGRELLMLGGVESATDTRIRLKWSPGLASMDAKWRIRHTTLGSERVYNIESVIDVGTRHQDIELMCSSGLNDG